MSYLHALRSLNRYGYLQGLDEIDISLGGKDFLHSSQVSQVQICKYMLLDGISRNPLQLIKQ